MKKVMIIAAAAALTCGASAFAANPFSDVSTSDWAYQAVTTLSEQGVVEGYPDGTFKGQQNITRYEMAQIIARMLAKEDQYNAEQRATIDKLASQYADELNSLGVRVSNLEKKVGNVRFDGDARMFYGQEYKQNGTTNELTTKSKDDWTGRIRLGATAYVNDNTYVYGRFVNEMDFVGEKDSDTSMDRLFVHHQFGKDAALTLGRSELWLGSTGMFYDDIFDGIRANVGTEKLGLEAGYGRFKTWNDLGQDYGSQNNPESWYTSLKGQAGPLTLGADYIDMSKSDFGDHMTLMGRFWGVNANVAFSKVSVFGDYYKNTKWTGDPAFYTAGLAYGAAKAEHPGSFRIGAQYVKAETGSYFGGTSMDIDPMSVLYAPNNGLKSVKFWQATADVVVMPNVTLHGEYAFNVKGDNTNGGTKDYDDLSTVSLNYVF